MAQTPMYEAIANSPGTELSADISASDTTIAVLDASKLPDAPNLFTVGSDETAETILYTGKSGNSLTGCTRGFNDTNAKGWSTGAKVARNFTGYDHDTFIANIDDLDERVTVAQAKADAAETPEGAQEKADDAQQAAVQTANAHANEIVGNLLDLSTVAKGNIVSAVNEVFQSGVDAKNEVVDAINAKGGSASTNDDWATIASKIGQISTGKRVATGTSVTTSGTNSPFSITGLAFTPGVVIWKFVAARYGAAFKTFPDGTAGSGFTYSSGTYTQDVPTWSSNGVSNIATRWTSGATINWICYEE